MLKFKLKITQLVLCSIASLALTGLFPVYAKTQVIDSDGDGLSDSYEEKIGTEAFLSDTDGDGLDDAFEVGKNLKTPLNHDGDRLIDARDADDDNDGLPTALEAKIDTDNDNIKNYLDPDSDNDGIKDGLEAGLSAKDSDFDRIDDSFDADNLGDPDKNGDGIADVIVFPDHNNDGIPDMLDKNFQYGVLKKKTADSNKLVKTNKNEALQKIKHKAKQKIEVHAKNSVKQTVKKVVQKPQQETTILTTQASKIEDVSSIKLNKYTDTDNDGLQDSLEKILGTNPKKRDTDGDKVSDAIEIGFNVKKPQDSDHDGIIDALDVDDDNDGVLTADEDVNKDSSPINDDTDEDGVPNYLDANDDGDDKLTIAEGSKRDTDKDGILDYLDKNDGVKDKPLFAKKEVLPEEPEVVVLSEPGELSAATEHELLTQNIRQLSNDRTIRTINALEEAIAQNNEPAKHHFEPLKPNEGKLARKKQVSLDHGYSKSDKGIVSWLKKLF